MPSSTIDPIDAAGSLFTSLFGRVILFLAAGVVGSFIGLLCDQFKNWDDFLPPFLHPGVDGFEVVINSALWLLFLAFSISWGILIAVPIICFAFYRLIFTEDPPGVHATIILFFSALGPVARENSAPTYAVFSVFLIGFGALFYYFFRRDFPERWESLATGFHRLFSGENKVTAVENDSSPAKKTGLKGWGENVELDNDEWNK
ncbi:MAG: hypothetical protein HKN23_20025 [Verrucomicrobiales bacterium]|nr:hypothetical protein [Verrucomicrobiales bacterium]